MILKIFRHNTYSNSQLLRRSTPELFVVSHMLNCGNQLIIIALMTGVRRRYNHCKCQKQVGGRGGNCDSLARDSSE